MHRTYAILLYRVHNIAHNRTEEQHRITEYKENSIKWDGVN